MPINATCQQCGATLPVPDEYAGQNVRCGGCQGVVTVPSTDAAAPPPPAAVPVARAVKARPVAVPVAAKAKPEPKADAPVHKARKVREDEDDEPEEEEDTPRERKPNRRPIAKRRRESMMTPTAFKWLALFLLTGTVGLGVLAYAAWGSSRKNDGTAYVPPDLDDDPKPPPPIVPQPVAAQPARRMEFAPPEEQRFRPADGQIDGRQMQFQPAFPPPQVGGPAPGVADQDPPFKRGPNAVLKGQRDRATFTASTEWQQWPASHAFDGDTRTSWFSKAEPAGGKPWVRVTFQNPVLVSRVVVLGNRDPSYDRGYTVRSAKIELLDANDRVIQSKELQGQGARHDFEWQFRGIRASAVRVTALTADNINSVAVGEIEID
jgi:hypothetical protein